MADAGCSGGIEQFSAADSRSPAFLTADSADLRFQEGRCAPWLEPHRVRHGLEALDRFASAGKPIGR